jgi:hypothetical protein
VDGSINSDAQVVGVMRTGVSACTCPRRTTSRSASTCGCR